MKRYLAADMRSALRAIRAEQGPDAVILSNRATASGVEVCAAVDLELAAGQGTLAETAELKQLERAALQELEREAAELAAGDLDSRGAAASADAAAAAAAYDLEPMPLGSVTDQTQHGAANRSVVEELRSLRERCSSNRWQPSPGMTFRGASR